MDKKKIFIFLISLLVLLSLVSFSFAAEEGEKVANWVSSLVKWIVRLAGLISFLALLYGGGLYLFSAGSVNAIKRARQQVIAGIGGLIIITTSYLVLQTINPQILGGISPTTPPDITDVSSPGTEIERTTHVYQEIPFGTLLETRILAKNISCFDESSRLVDCHSQESISQEEKESIAKKMSQEFPEQWPDAQPKDAEIAYLCYAFDEDGEFIDPDPTQPGIQPTTQRDRLDCLEKINQALEAKSQYLKEVVNELTELSEQCACGLCTCGACPCIPAPGGTCPCGGTCNGECCPGRARMDQIREELFKEGGAGLYMNQTIQGHNCLLDSELVKVDVDHYSDLTVVNQIRWLSYHFLPAYIASLKTDISYLEKAENIYKNHCPYQASISYSSIQDLITKGELTEKIRFCANSNGAQWGERCIEEEQLRITKFCQDFNCQDCRIEGEKILCEQCKLDDLKKGKEVEWTWQDQTYTTYQCSKFLINNEEGEDQVEPPDKMGVMCKIMPPSEALAEASDQERQCYDYYDQDALTIYCPEADSLKAEHLLSRYFISEGVVRPQPAEGFPIGTIQLGEMVDNAEAYVKQLTDELKIIIETPTPEIVCPSYDKNDPDNECKLFHNTDDSHCTCEKGCLVNQDVAGCGPSCSEKHGCRCNDCGHCPACPCALCNCPGSISPCPIRTIRERNEEIKYWYDEDPESMKTKTDRVIDLIEARNLKTGDQDRWEMICQLVDSRTKFNEGIPGFGAVDEHTTRIVDLNSCLVILERMNTQKVKVFPQFENCYPYTSSSLTEEEKNACLENRWSLECLDAVKDLMQNFFFIEEGTSS